MLFAIVFYLFVYVLYIIVEIKPPPSPVTNNFSSTAMYSWENKCGKLFENTPKTFGMDEEKFK